LQRSHDLSNRRYAVSGAPFSHLANDPFRSTRIAHRGRADADERRAGQDVLNRVRAGRHTAYAEDGQFDKAVKVQKQALQSPDDFPKKELEKAKQRLKLYMEGKPYRKE